MREDRGHISREERRRGNMRIKLVRRELRGHHIANHGAK
jgi:hypothetical protein